MYVSGVIIQTIECGPVWTKMLDKALTMDGLTLPSLESTKAMTAVSPDLFVKSAVNTIGWANHCNGHFLHWIAATSRYFIPKNVTDRQLLEGMETLHESQ